ncbi:major membrane immunogen, membrane-anchored lipoprotein [Desulfitobacterium sp. PCE1]|uniref:major membrane immunogen, membrane-anchored lipoprotein n=1 Tax=Desulfitobacterium sp. PCE1 TaxID=146907 RepID=UPI00037CF6C9|nr:major membrane immunogen, membrane-anchored lipoprotein [Desulfitobacterium sp. PCE1]
MKKIKSIMSVFALGTVLVLSGCTGGQTTPATAVKDPAPAQDGKYKDGNYFAQQDAFAKGWKYMVTIEVKDGKIASADWNGANEKGGPDKVAFSASGQYGMKKGGAQSEWHEQAEKAEAYLVQTQDPTKINYKDDAGHSDDIAGVSVGVKDFFELAKKALDAGPVEKGPYKDGAYYAEAPMYGKDGWKYSASLTVVNGNIVAADWNGLNVKGGKDKDTLSADGEYGMKEKGKAQAEWHEQAQKAEAYLLKTQDPTKVNYKDDAGKTDDIAGVSIKVKDFFELAKAALDKGPIAQGSYKDGLYYAADEKFEKGWKYMTSIVVKNGTIVGVDWNGIPEDATKPNKDVQSTNGDYKLAPGNQGEWAVQAQKAEAHLLKTQDPTKITYKDDAGHSDDIAGVSVTVGEFFKLAQKALEGAK